MELWLIETLIVGATCGSVVAAGRRPIRRRTAIVENKDRQPTLEEY